MGHFWLCRFPVFCVLNLIRTALRKQNKKKVEGACGSSAMHKSMQIQVKRCSQQTSENGKNVISVTLTVAGLLVPDGVV